MKFIFLMLFLIYGHSAVVALEILPSGQRWLIHLKTELLPFWMMEAALGTPVGNFPTFRCNDGRVYNPKLPCRELSQAVHWIKKHLQQNFLRVNARQVYAYGIGYHLTGAAQYFDRMQQGIAFIRQQVWGDSNNLSSYRLAGNQKPTSQDLAHIQLGLALYYYLTRDEAVLADIIQLKKFIFKHYAQELLMTSTTVTQQQPTLSAQLTQVNAYMLLMTPLLPKPIQKTWQQELLYFAKMMRTHFYSEQNHCFYQHRAQANDTDLKHCDWGNTIKALVMIYHIGQLTQQHDLVVFARAQLSVIFEQAFVQPTTHHPGFWASGQRADGSLNKNKIWWIYAQFDQAAATLSLAHERFTQYLIETYNYWFNYWVDKKHYEVWHLIDVNGVPQFPKAHLWKNGYHSTEHALIGYLTAQALHHKPVTLYYALNAHTKATLLPYWFSGTITQKTTTGPLTVGLEQVKVVFEQLH